MQERQLLKRHGIRVVKRKIARAFSDQGDCLAGVVLEDGEEIALRYVCPPSQLKIHFSLESICPNLCS